jgi:hypothetical protein
MERQYANMLTTEWFLSRNICMGEMERATEQNERIRHLHHNFLFVCPLQDFWNETAVVTAALQTLYFDGSENGNIRPLLDISFSFNDKKPGL